MHNCALFQVSKFTHEFFEHKRFTEEKIMEWPPSSSNLYPIKDLWSILKTKLYEDGKQYKSRSDLWEVSKITTLENITTGVKIN